MIYLKKLSINLHRKNILNHTKESNFQIGIQTAQLEIKC